MNEIESCKIAGGDPVDHMSSLGSEHVIFGVNGVIPIS